MDEENNNIENQAEEEITQEQQQQGKKQTGSLAGAIIVIIVIIIGGLYFWGSKNKVDTPTDEMTPEGLTMDENEMNTPADIILPGEELGEIEPDEAISPTIAE